MLCLAWEGRAGRVSGGRAKKDGGGEGGLSSARVGQGRAAVEGRPRVEGRAGQGVGPAHDRVVVVVFFWWGNPDFWWVNQGFWWVNPGFWWVNQGFLVGESWWVNLGG